MSANIFFRTFGCKTNQYDSALMGQSLEQAGFTLAESPAGSDWVVVNTCAVTKRGEDKARQWVRRVAREHPDTRIAVVGCSVEASGKKFAGIEGVRLLLGTEEKFRLGEVLARADDNRDGILTAAGGVATQSEYADLPVLEAHRGRARGYVKVQDGCDNRCTYCIVPLVRGASRSRAIEKVVEEAAGLERSGHAEAVLTGIHIGKYGRDLAEDLSLSSLVAAVLDATKEIRLRLSSVEVGELDGALVDHVAGSPRVCRHLHIPLQHGSDPVLRRMDRGYSSAEFSDCVESVAGRVPGLGLGTDVIAGFPGESEQDFRATYDLLDALPFSYLHVFPYSPRPGTPASEMQGRPPKAEVTRRVRELRVLSARKNLAFRKSLAGQRLEVIREVTDSSGAHQCRSDNYVLLSFRGECPPGRFELLAAEPDKDGLRAVLPGD